MPLYNSSEVFVPAKQYGNTIHSDSLDIKKTELACVSANGSDVYFEAERSLPKCAWNCEK